MATRRFLSTYQKAMFFASPRCWSPIKGMLAQGHKPHDRVTLRIADGPSPCTSGSLPCLSRMLPAVFTRKSFGKSQRVSSPSHKHRLPLHKLCWRVSQDLEARNLQHLMRANTDSKEVCKPGLTLG